MHCATKGCFLPCSLSSTPRCHNIHSVSFSAIVSIQLRARQLYADHAERTHVPICPKYAKKPSIVNRCNIFQAQQNINHVKALSTDMKCVFALPLFLILLLFQMLSLILLAVLAPSLAESCSASQHHPHFLRRNPPLFTLSKNSTKTEKLCAIQLRGEHYLKEVMLRSSFTETFRT